MVYIYTSELFPTSHRGISFGIANIGARVGGALAPVFLVVKTPSIIFGSIAIAGAVLTSIFLPETSNIQTLETMVDMKALGGSIAKLNSRNVGTKAAYKLISE